MGRGISTLLTTALFIFLIFSVYLQIWGLPSEARAIAKTFPEVEPIVVPSIIWGVLAIACWEFVAILGLRVTVLARQDKLDSAASPLLRAMVISLGVFFVLVVGAFIALSVMGHLTAGAMLGLLASGLVSLCGASGLGLYLAVRR